MDTRHLTSRLHVALFFLSTLAASTCGGGASSVDGAVKRNTAAGDRLVEDVAAAHCSWQFRCCTTYEIDVLAKMPYGTYAACIDHVTLTLRTLLAPDLARLAVEGTDLDEAKVDACLEAYRSLSCIDPMQPQTFNPDVPACQRLFVGRLREGASCYGASDCAPGTFCSTASFQIAQNGPVGPRLPISLSSNIEGACVVPQKEGDVCNTDRECDVEGGQHCDRLESRCRPLRGEGEACVFDGDAQLSIGQCDPSLGLHCDLLSQTCRRLPRENEPCVSQDLGLPLCDPDPALALQCVGAAFNGTGVCLKPGKLGDPCGGDGVPNCGPAFFCAQTQAPGHVIPECAARAALGASCNGGIPCIAPAMCDETETCVLPGPRQALEPCTDHAQCASFRCDFVGGGGERACVPRDMALVCTGGGPGPDAAPPDAGPAD